MSLVGFEGSVDNIRILDHELPLEQFAEMSRSIIKTYTGVYHGLCWNRTTRTPARLTKHILGTGGRAGVQSDDSDKWTVTNDLYMGGDNGQLAHYDGIVWKKVETGTTLPVKDIFGALDAKTSNYEVLAVAGDQYSSLDRIILKLDGLLASPLSDQPLTVPVTSVWFAPGKRYYIAGAGIYHKDELSDSLWKGGLSDVTTNYVEDVRGEAANDLFAAGDFGELLHYSGKTWHSYRTEVGLVGGVFYGLAVKGGIVIAVGTDPPNGVIVVGRRGL